MDICIEQAPVSVRQVGAYKIIEFRFTCAGSSDVETGNSFENDDGTLKPFIENARDSGEFLATTKLEMNPKYGKYTVAFKDGPKRKFNKGGASRAPAPVQEKQDVKVVHDVPAPIKGYSGITYNEYITVLAKAAFDVNKIIRNVAPSAGDSAVLEAIQKIITGGMISYMNGQMVRMSEADLLALKETSADLYEASKSELEKLLNGKPTATDLSTFIEKVSEAQILPEQKKPLIEAAVARLAKVSG